MPRVMLSTPDAMPACCPGAAPMIDALLGDVNRPMPTPTAARQEQQHGRRPGHRPMTRQAGGHERHAAHGERPGPDAVGQAPRQRRDHDPKASGMAMSSSPDAPSQAQPPLQGRRAPATARRT